MNFEEAQSNFENIVSNISSEQLAQFFDWIQRKYLVAECEGESKAIAHSKLYEISCDIKNKLPYQGIMSTEKIEFPDNEKWEPTHSVQVDAFLYDQVDIDDLVKSGGLQQYYCKDCNSRNIGEITFISHSASKQRIEFIFSAFLKDVDFSNKKVLDIGSRFGGLLYGAYLFTNAPQIVGIEMNKELCDIQNEIINKYQMTDRIKIIQNDVCNESDVVKTADVIILNNVFEFFQDKSKQVLDWIFLKNNVKSGTILVTIPSLEESLKRFPQTGIILDKWVSKKEIRDPLLAMSVQEQDDLDEICVYKVL